MERSVGMEVEFQSSSCCEST